MNAYEVKADVVNVAVRRKFPKCGRLNRPALWPTFGRTMYRLMLLGRAAPVVNARLPMTEANVVSEDCGRGRGPSYTTPPSYSLYDSCGWERSVAVPAGNHW